MLIVLITGKKNAARFQVYKLCAEPENHFLMI